MARNYSPTKRKWIEGRSLSTGRIDVSRLEKTERDNDWKKVSPEESCQTLKDLGSRTISPVNQNPLEGNCPKWAAGHHMHQFTFDLTQRQCCRCELVVPQLDYIELQDEGIC